MTAPATLPLRTVRLLVPPGPGRAGAFELVVPRPKRRTPERSIYLVEYLESDFGESFRLTKLAGDRRRGCPIYHVGLEPDKAHCNCPAAARWGGCRHIAAMRALRSASVL